MLYNLKVLKEVTLPDGRLFLPGHDVNSLDAFEVSDLVTDNPDVFEAADDVTKGFLENVENVAHLAAAVKRKREESGIVGNLSAKKVNK